MEIWRLAVLYVYGGLYMDDDAVLGARLDDIVTPDDKFIIAKVRRWPAWKCCL